MHMEINGAMDVTMIVYVKTDKVADTDVITNAHYITTYQVPVPLYKVLMTAVKNQCVTLTNIYKLWKVPLQL